MAQKQTTAFGGLGSGTVLFLIFLVLKLTGTIDWSWWWVTAPLWIPVAGLLLLMALIGIITVTVKVVLK